MRWKAGALLVGVAVMLAGLTTWIVRRADSGDDRRQALEMDASLAAARVDASVSRVSTTMMLAGSDVEVERLADAIGVPVCRFGERPACAPANGSLGADPIEAFEEADLAHAYEMAAARSRVAGRPVAAVVTDGARSPGTAIVVVVQHPGGATAAVLPVEPDELLPAATAESEEVVAASLSTEFVNGAWSTRGVSDGNNDAGSDLTWLNALQIVGGAFVVLVAIVAMTRDQRRLSRRATIDALTGLPNRAEFERRASRRLTQLGRDGDGACLIVIDLDGFKAINDSAGHAAGDRVLAEAGRRLAAAVRSTDLVGRWGGDEFVLLLVGVSDPLAIPDRTASIAACLNDLTGDASTRLTASVGAAAFPLQGRDLATLLDLADRAMYSAKPRASVVDATRSGGDGAPAVPWRP